MCIGGIFSSLYLNYVYKSDTDPVNNKCSHETWVPSSFEGFGCGDSTSQHWPTWATAVGQGPARSPQPESGFPFPDLSKGSGAEGVKPPGVEVGSRTEDLESRLLGFLVISD